MTELTRINLIGLLCLLFHLPIFSQNIAIIESQSKHPLQKMDVYWQTTATNLGFSADILEQNALDHIDNLVDYDILIISSGLIIVPEERQTVVHQFIEGGRSAYIQSEYLTSLSGNVMFEHSVNSLGGNFNWEGEETGNLAPITALDPILSVVAPAQDINYFWYGTYGSGDQSITPFLEKDSRQYAFIFTPPMPNNGMIITTSDQDWIRTANNPQLVENILFFLSDFEPIAELPTVSIELISENNCPDESYVFTTTITNQTAGTVLQWTINGTPITGASDNIFITSDISEGDVVECILILNSYQHVSNPLMIDPIFPLETPTISLAANTTSFCELEEMTFTATTSNLVDASNITYQWFINNSPVLNATELTFSSTELNNNDLVNCSIIYDNTCSTSNSILAEAIQISIMNAITPSINISANATEICKNEQVIFTVSGTNWGTNTDFQWKINGNNVGANQPTFTTVEFQNGQQVTCTATFNLDCSNHGELTTEAMSVNVINPSLPTAILTSDVSVICPNNLVTFSVTGEHWGDNPSFNWLIDGNFVNSSIEPTFQTSTLNGQQVSCVVNTNAYCVALSEISSEVVSIEVIQEEMPAISIDANINNACEGTPITFFAKTQNIGITSTFQWKIDGNNVGTNENIFTTSELLNGQIVSCQLVSSYECQEEIEIASNEVEINIGALSIEVLEVIHETCLQANGIIEVGAFGGIAPYTFTWNNGNTAQFVDQLTAGEYELHVSDAIGCSSSINVTIESLETPEILEVSSVDAVCAEDKGSAKVTMVDDSRNYKYQWVTERNFLLSTADSVADLTPGNYEVIITDEFGCSVSQALTIVNSAELNIEVEAAQRIVLGESTRLGFTISSTSNVTYEWFPATGLSCTDCADPKASPIETTVYTLIVTNETGCTQQSEIAVQVTPNRDVYIPNVFSPNADGVNDYFMVFGGNNIDKINKMEVVDRWRNIVYQGTDLPVNNESEGWNGMARGKLAATGVYMYVVEIQFLDGEKEVIHGDLSIVK